MVPNLHKTNILSEIAQTATITFSSVAVSIDMTPKEKSDISSYGSNSEKHVISRKVGI